MSWLKAYALAVAILLIVCLILRFIFLRADLIGPSLFILVAAWMTIWTAVKLKERK